MAIMLGFRGSKIPEAILQNLAKPGVAALRLESKCWLRYFTLMAPK
jgi:hypothetical protein